MLFYSGLIFLLILTVFIFYLFNKYWRLFYLSTKVPGPSGLPFIGNGLIFLNKKSKENLQILRKLVDDYGNVYRLWLGPDLFCVMTDVKDLEVIMSSTKFGKSGDYKYLSPWLREGLLVSNGKKWHQRRKILTPSFHFKILEQFVDIFNKQSTIFMDILNKQIAVSDTIELFPLITNYALDVICESAMGTSVNAQYDSDSLYIKKLKEIAGIVHHRQFDFVERFNFFYQFTTNAKREQEILKILHGFTRKVIQERRAELINRTTDDTDAVGFDRKQRNFFLDTLLIADCDGSPLSDADIQEEVDTFMFEGHDTTTSGIAFTLYAIAKHPDVQEKCYEEIVRVIGMDKMKSVSYGELNELHYLEKVIKEALRLYPSVPLIARRLDEEMTINNYTYARNTSFLIPIYAIGRQEKYFPNANEFRPERFDRQAANPFTHIPFSAGPRNCIGQKFATLEMM